MRRRAHCASGDEEEEEGGEAAKEERGCQERWVMVVLGEEVGRGIGEG